MTREYVRGASYLKGAHVLKHVVPVLRSGACNGLFMLTLHDTYT